MRTVAIEDKAADAAVKNAVGARMSKEALTYDLLVRYQGVEHFRKSASPALWYTLPLDTPESSLQLEPLRNALDDRQPVKRPAEVMEERVELEYDGEPDGEDAAPPPSAIVPAPEERPRLYFRVVSTNPSLLKNVRKPRATSSELLSTDLAISIHRCTNGETGPLVQMEPIVKGA